LIFTDFLSSDVESVMPRSRFSERTISRHRNWNPQMSVPPVSATGASGKPAQEQLDSLLRERLDFHSQLFEAAQIQRKLSGPSGLLHGKMQFAKEVFAAHYLPGDFVVLSQDGPKVLATLGDIAGKGFAAGMWFTNLAGLLQSYSHPYSDPARTAAEINRHLCYLRPVAPFVTAFFAQVDCEDGTLTYCNAGHFPPILLRADGRTEILDRGGPLLGALEPTSFESGQVSFGAGDILVAYSDGVLECQNSAGEEFGMDRLSGALHKAKQPTAQETLVQLLAAVQDFANGSSLCDDLSLLVVQRDSNR
jgi:sigma-B regulation protein RsbU (phosphoserine phosphatase)